jgi:hypothetical protein
MDSAQKIPAESARTKHEHMAAAMYHWKREEEILRQCKEVTSAAWVHGSAAMLHAQAALYGTDAPMKWHRGGNRAVGSVARDQSQWARRCDESEDGDYDPQLGEWGLIY